jgi:hypothetical protein
MKKRLPLIVAIAALVLLIPALALARGKPTTFVANLSSLNGSGVTATAWLTLDGNQVHVTMVERGLEAGPHPQHIHGKTSADIRNGTDASSNTVVGKCPAPSRDTDGDGLISFAEGLPDYGPVMVKFGAPAANADGTFTLEGDFATPTTDLGIRTVVIHGMTVNGTYVAGQPVACGQVHPIGN